MLNYDEITKIIEHIHCELHILKLLAVYKENDRIIALIDEVNNDIDRLIFTLTSDIQIQDETSIETLILTTKEKMQYAAMEALRFLSEKGYDLNADIYLLFYSLPAIFQIQESAGKTEKEIYKILCDFIEKYKS
jgi:hypothetical protein